MIHISQIRQMLLLFLIAALFGLIFWNLKLFVPALLGAYTLYVLLRKPTRYLTENRKWNHKLSVIVMMLVSFLAILLPINGFIQMLRTKVVDGFENKEKIIKPLESAILKLEKSTGLDLLTPERLQNLSEWGAQAASNVVNATLFFLLMLLVTYLILWFMLTAGEKMEHSFFSWLPLKDTNIEFLRKELNDLVFSNALGIPLMGVAQGVAGLIGYSLAGVEDVWFWVFMTFIAGMIPFLGVSLAFVPLALVLFSKDMNGAAIFILIYGFVVIGSVDNFARMWLMNKIGHTHPLITLFGVIIGVQLFGFVGFIFGPIMIAMFLLLVKIYTKEFR